jgi:hypothetical protein
MKYVLYVNGGFAASNVDLKPILEIAGRILLETWTIKITITKAHDPIPQKEAE